MSKYEMNKSLHKYILYPDRIAKPTTKIKEVANWWMCQAYILRTFLSGAPLLFVIG